MSMVSSKLRIRPLERRISVGFGFLDPRRQKSAPRKPLYIFKNAFVQCLQVFSPNKGGSKYGVFFIAGRSSEVMVERVPLTRFDALFCSGCVARSSLILR